MLSALKYGRSLRLDCVHSFFFNEGEFSLFTRLSGRLKENHEPFFSLLPLLYLFHKRTQKKLIIGSFNDLPRRVEKNYELAWLFISDDKTTCCFSLTHIEKERSLDGIERYVSTEVV